MKSHGLIFSTVAFMFIAMLSAMMPNDTESVQQFELLLDVADVALWAASICFLLFMVQVVTDLYKERYK